MMMEFKEMLIRAKRGEKNAQEKLLEMYRPLLMRESTRTGRTRDNRKIALERHVECLALSLRHSNTKVLTNTFKNCRNVNGGRGLLTSLRYLLPFHPPERSLSFGTLGSCC